MLSFDNIPVGIETPLAYVEFNNTKATSGVTAIPHKILVMGQKTAAGTAAAAVANRVTSVDQAIDLYGRGSLLHQMFAALKANNGFTESWGIALADGAGVQASGTITVSGPATENGVVTLYIGGKRITVAVTSGDSADAIAGAIDAAINADLDLPVTSAAVAAVVTVTCRWIGETGNDIDIRYNYFDDERLPAGVGIVIAAMSAGTVNPDVADVFTAIGDTQYRTIVNPWTDAANLTALDTELEDRFGPLRAIEGTGFQAQRGTVAALGTFGAALNSKHLVVVGYDDGPDSPWEWAAAMAGQIAFYGVNDPARPFQTLPLTGLKAPPEESRFTREERNILLDSDGVSSFVVDDGGVVRIERAVTSYKTNALAVEDKSYHDLNTPLTLFFLRFTLRARIALKFPRYKLADDGTAYSPGQAVVTPRIVRSEIIAWFREMEALGLVEDIEQFKTDLIVERDATDPNRINALVPANLVNQLRIFAGSIEFRL